MKYDVIIIGSGMGGMTVGSLLARLFKKKVFLIERHYTFGGLTHEFRRKDVTFSPGLHYVGQMQEGSSFRKMMNAITNNKVSWQPLPHDYDFFMYPGLTFKAISNKDNYINELITHFPAEEKSIRIYFKEIGKYSLFITKISSQVNR